jgi:hypothetical protein
VTGISQAIGEMDTPHVDAALLDAFFGLIFRPMAKSERSAISALTDRQIAPPWLVLSYSKERALVAQLDNLIPIGTSFSSTWKHLYECAMLEFDKNKLPERIAAAHRAIVERAEEIITNQSTDEHYALNDALRALQLLEQIAAREKPTA